MRSMKLPVRRNDIERSPSGKRKNNDGQLRRKIKVRRKLSKKKMLPKKGMLKPKKQ